MPIAKPIPGVYQKFGVRPIIHGAGTTTRYGGSLMRPETIAAMQEASQAFVNIDELNEAAGAAIARRLGAEAAFVTGGAAAGLVLQAAACMTGDDPAKVARLPDTTGMKNEFIIQRAHRFMYDQAFRVAGGVLVEIGIGRRTAPYELESAMTEQTAGVVYLVSPFTSPPGILPFEDVCEIAHRHSVPVVVDAASMLPPRENLFKYLRMGADLVNFSGGKGIRGPQSTGMLAGRKDLIRAAVLNSSPNQGVGRAAKTSKEEIVGLVTALELFLTEDEETEMNRYREVCTSIVDAVRDLPGIRLWSNRMPSTGSYLMQWSTSSHRGMALQAMLSRWRWPRVSPTSTSSRDHTRGATSTKLPLTQSTSSLVTRKSSPRACARN